MAFFFFSRNSNYAPDERAWIRKVLSLMFFERMSCWLSSRWLGFQNTMYTVLPKSILIKGIQNLGADRSIDAFWTNYIIGLSFVNLRFLRFSTLVLGREYEYVYEETITLQASIVMSWTKIENVALFWLTLSYQSRKSVQNKTGEHFTLNIHCFPYDSKSNS